MCGIIRTREGEEDCAGGGGHIFLAFSFFMFTKKDLLMLHMLRRWFCFFPFFSDYIPGGWLYMGS